MSSVSPEKPAVAKTYLSRAKKNRFPKDPPFKPSKGQESDSEDGDEDAIMTDAKPSKPTTRKETAPAPVSPGKVPKKVGVHLPGPSPRTAKAEAQNASPATKKAKSQHIRSMSSISSMKRINDDATDSPSSKKPNSISAIKRKRFATPEGVDGNASVAESSISMGAGAIRRTEAERIEYFNNQPDCTNIEQHSVTCTRCNKVVQLGRNQTYTVRPWETHRKRCDQKPSSVLDDGASMRSDMIPESGPRKQLNESQRKQQLESDQRAETVEEDKVLCKKCNKWVRLSNRTKYSLANWTNHQAECADVVVSSRVAMAQRKISLVNDAQAKTSGPRNVECRECGANVALEGEWDYTLTSWELHKQTCKPKPPRAPRSSAGGSVSTEATVVAGGGAEASSSRGTKRRLEDPEVELEADDLDARKVNRPRTETYEPVQKDPPSILGWFLLPFKAFIDGFKESIAETPP